MTEPVSIPELPPEVSQLEGSEEQHSTNESEAVAEVAADAPPEEVDARPLLERVGISLEALQQEFFSSGKLSDESYNRLTDAGFPREMVDSYIDGVQAKASVIRADIFSAVGGEEAYLEIAHWASSNLTKAEIDGLNRSLMAGVVQAKLALTGLKSKYEAANGRKPKLVQGENSVSSVGAYSNRAEIVKAMRDPKYKTDAAYRERVIEKIKRSRRDLV